MAEYKGVMVLGEVIDDKLAAITTEILGCGRRLADELKEELSCILMGGEVAKVADEAIAFGADKVYIAEDSLLKDYRTDSYIVVTEKIVQEATPRILLLGQTAVGRDLAPKLAFRLGTSLATDCLELEVDTKAKLLSATRSVYGGNARAIFTSESLPQMATARQKAMSPLERDDSRKGEIISVKVEIDPAEIRTDVIEKVEEEAAGIKLEDASIIVSGGRGIGGPEGFEQLEELAKILKGALGASRPPCDNGWTPTTAQVGLTGKIVAPDLYIAVAISGASQHLAGCSGSKNIVAINRDAEANIFKEARLGVVADWKQIIPPLTERVRELMAG